MPPGIYTPLEYDIYMFLDDAHFNASQPEGFDRLPGRCNITFAVHQSSPYLWIHAAASMRFLQIALQVHDRGVLINAAFQDSLYMLCHRYMGIPSRVPDCSRIMQRTG